MRIQNSQIEQFVASISQKSIFGCLIFGPDDAVISYRLNSISKAILPNSAKDPFAITRISKFNIRENPGVIIDEFLSYSMFGDRKLIIVEDADNSCVDSLKFCLSKPYSKENNFLILVAGDLDKYSKLRKIGEESEFFVSIPCYEDDERFLKSFILSELNRRSIGFDKTVPEILLNHVGKNRQLIVAQIEKADIFLGEKRFLFADVADSLFVGDGDASVNELLENFASNNFQKCALLIEVLIKNGVEAISIVRALISYLQKAYQAKKETDLEGTSLDDAVMRQKLFFKIEKSFRNFLMTNSLHQITKKLLALNDLEIKVKSSNLGSEILLLSFLVDEISNENFI